MNWQPIETLQEGGKEVVCLIGIAPSGYVTDPWTGWKMFRGGYARWPHPFPPTHWCRIPKFQPPTTDKED